MRQQTIRSILTLFGIALVTATSAFAQSSTSINENSVINTKNSWQVAQSVGSSKGKLFVVTIDQPNRKQTCRIQSFTVDKLVCTRAIGGPRTYLPQQVTALILPGDNNLMIGFLIGFNGALGA
jgi:hypothetical protein